MTTYSAVTKLLRKEFNIKNDEVLIEFYNNLPESFYQTIYFQSKDLIVKKIKRLVLEINMDADTISETISDIREGSLSGFRSAHNILINLNKKRKNTLKVQVSILVSNIEQSDWAKLEFKKKAKNIAPAV